MGKITISDNGVFTFGWSEEFFVETNKGNFIFSDPGFGGDNTMRPFYGSIDGWVQGLPYAAINKGRHVIKDFCGNVNFVNS